MTSREATPTAAAVPAQTRPPFDRHGWERTVITSSLHHNPRHVALLLSHYADDAGYLPPGGPQHVESLSSGTGLSGRLVRQSLTQLEHYGLISRPPIHGWDTRRGIRPLTLTTPRTRPGSEAAEGAVRTEPAHPGETR
ncbi:hypothetical protein QF032_001357 [Streptomyces achromogenes]|uniref:hypothetical protein n=1 Tax=Streptomyces achromogenes TaxID=67255 RepID=UPI0027864F86|nr:hypothetical protein [Streptomyces achromogenes]MDQ0829513.1 hypothetical protein [Streptomyces achromogenes]